MQNKSKHEPTDNYFYPEINISKCMLRLNLHVYPVRTQITNTQKMNKSEMSTQKTPNLHVYSS